MVSPLAASIARRSSILPIGTALLAAVIFVADVLTPPDCVVSGLYVVVTLLAGQFSRGRQLWLIATGCAALTIIAQFLAHRLISSSDQLLYIGTFNALVSIIALVLSTYLVERGHAAEESVRRAQADLAHVSRITTMGELTASIAHEVNQPIAGVVANANACLRWLGGDPPQLDEARAAANRIVRDGTRAADIIGRIRKVFAKSGAQKAPVDLNRVIRETVEILESQASRNAVSMRMELEAGLPLVPGDEVQIQQVIVNLVINAVEAMQDAPGARELIVKSRRSESGNMIVSVSDSGVGFPADHAPRIFDAFFTTKSQGTGMGLSISRSIVEAHHGRLFAEPNSPRGAVFSFELPSDDRLD